VVEMETHEQAEIMIDHLPAWVKAWFQSVAEASSAVDRARRAASWQMRETDRLHDLWWNGGNVFYGISVTSSSRTGITNDTEAQRKANYDASLIALGNARAILAMSESAYAAVLRQRAAETTVLSMYSGRTWSGAPIWDCGQRMVEWKR